MINVTNIIISLMITLGCWYSDISNRDRKDLPDTPKKGSYQMAISVRKPSDAKTISITASYAAIECGCPQWFETKFKKQPFLKGVERFYLEPTNKTLINANDLWDGQTLPLTLKLVGRFSEKKGEPRTYHTKATPEMARIFWYDKIVIVSGPKAKK